MTPPRALPPRRLFLGGRWSSGLLMAACGLSLLLFGAVSHATAADSGPVEHIDLSGYAGHWERIHDDRMNEDRLAAIKIALSDLSWLMRQFASPILRNTTTPHTEMDFVWNGRLLHQSATGTNGHDAREIHLDGATLVAKDNRGDEFSSAWTWTGSDLRLSWEQDQATGITVFRIDDESQTLVVEHTIEVTAISNIGQIFFLAHFARTAD
ncbi:MAG: hypothetical protein VCB25_06070 [Myxococcota bacterium]